MTEVQTKTRKKPVKREFNALGKFFATVRIHAEITYQEWVKALGTSSNTIGSIERGDGKMTLDFVHKVITLLKDKAPQFLDDFNIIVANQLGVLLIPDNTYSSNIQAAYDILNAPYPEPVKYDGEDGDDCKVDE